MSFMDKCEKYLDDQHGKLNDDMLIEVIFLILVHSLTLNTVIIFQILTSIYRSLI